MRIVAKSGEKREKVGKSEKSGEKWQILDIIKFLLSSFIKDHLGLLVQVMYDNYCPAITC